MPHFGSTRNFGAELQERRQQFVARDVVLFDDRETEGAERFRHRPGVIDRVAQRANGGFVAAVANHERDPRGLRLIRRSCGRRGDPKRPNQREREMDDDLIDLHGDAC